jgi:hypothetical protein
MLQALERAMAGYGNRSADVAGLSERIRRAGADENLVEDTVALTVDQRLAEANLSVAHVADDMASSLIHVIA